MQLIDPIALLIQQFRDKPRMGAVLTVFITALQEVSDVFDEIKAFLNIDTQEGTQLDVIGDILWCVRPAPPPLGTIDADYRTLLKTQIILNHSGGEAEALITACQEMVQATGILFEEHGDAVASITALTPNDLPDNLVQQLNRIKEAGVQLIVQASLTNCFRYDTAGQGFDQGNLSQQLS
jgi:hypothetical protein